MPTAKRNWRLEIAAWLAAIALVAAALVFSSGADEPVSPDGEHAVPEQPAVEIPSVRP